MAEKNRRKRTDWGVQLLERRLFLSTINGPCPNDPDGSPVPAGIVPVVTQSPTGASSTFPLSSVPQLHSDPGAKDQLYLDFVGAPAQNWGGYAVPATPAFDQDGDPTTFSSGELVAIQQIWAVVSEAYSPFNIDVTTVAPASLVHNQNLEIVIGGTGTWTGATYGGLSYTGAFANAFEPNISWVFSENLGNNPFYCGEASSHEAGHEFGLNHQSVYSGTTLVEEYNPGNSLTAPIMGDSYGAQRGLWWDGQSDVSSTTIQADMSVISSATNGFGYKAPEHGQSIATASAMSVSGTSVSGSGIIAQTTETDFFSFSTAAGSVTLNVNTIAFGATLHAKMQLFDASGNLLATVANANTLGQTITDTLAAGTYYVSVDSYGQYGDVGQYTVSGTVSLAPTPVTLGQSSDHLHINWTQGTSSGQVLITDPNGLSFTGDGQDDPITLNYANGNPLPVALHLSGIFTIFGLQGTNPLAGTTLDIGASTVFINYANTLSDPIAAIRSYLQNGYNHGAWNGTPTATTGVITSAAAQINPNQNTAIGYADWADGTGVDAIPNTIELKYTLDGDANLDGTVNSADLQVLLADLNRAGTWDQGDFNYDDSVNSADLQILLSTLNTSLGNQAAPAITATVSTSTGPLTETGSAAVRSPPQPLPVSTRARRIHRATSRVVAIPGLSDTGQG